MPGGDGRGGLFSLSQATMATGGEKENAIKIAKQARKIFGKTPKTSKKEIEEINAWLKERQADL